MPRDDGRRAWLRDGMKEASLDAVILSLPANVLMATGYFPVVGTSVVLVTREGEIDLIAPEDEGELAQQGGADRVIPFQPGSLEKIATAADFIRQPLRELVQRALPERAIVGYDTGEATEPASYAAMHLYGDSLPALLDRPVTRPALEFLSRMKATLTPMELERVRRSCRIASSAFERGRERLAAGGKESEAAEAFRAPLLTAGIGFEGANRAGGDVFCMAGAHSAEAFGAYARSRASAIEPSDFVLMHCNSHADGYFTDITRTYCLAPATDWHRKLYAAVFEARAAALDAIRPGAKARDIDRAARDVIRSHGFGAQFKHGTGHGVGFAAIDGNARPRIHPQSDDVLAPGMVFNIEPAIYIEGRGGLRHCDMTAVTATGVELLTPFQCRPEELIR